MSSQEPDDSGVNTPVDVPEPPEAAASDGLPGVQLLAERRAQGLSLGDVARQLKLSVRQVEALERDEYAAFPGPVFVRGFLRNYAKLLQLDPEALVARAAIAAGPGSHAAASMPPTPVPLQESRSGRRSRFGFGTLTLGLVLLIVVAAAIYDARNKPAPVSLAPASAVPGGQAHSPQHADSPPPSAPGTSVAPAAVAPGAAVAPAATDAPAAPDATAGVAPAAATTTTAPASTAAPTAAPGAAPAAAPPTPASPPAAGVAEIKLNFDDESWVEVKDGTGAVIFSRLNPAGAEQVVTGAAPLDVVIGNARSVRLSYRNKPVDLAPHTRVDVARVRLE
jgi:cytoskeleton protein RodZ